MRKTPPPGVAPLLVETTTVRAVLKEPLTIELSWTT
jgi:hypothetical protein